jgi:hypothetical protein
VSTLERAIAIAVAAHTGATDKAGAPYILHPLRVMLTLQGEAHRIAAVLHDVVEDTSVTIEQLRELGFASEVLDAIDAVTKRPEDESDYFGFIERAAVNDIGRAVKLADIEDNMDATRIASLTPKDELRLQRYARARKLVHLIGRERGDLTPRAPTILPLRNRNTHDEVLAECPGTRPIHVCDFYLEGAETGDSVVGGLRTGRVLNIDHHAPVARMETRQVTSTALAYEYLSERPVAAPAAWVVINHTDCDSMLSSAMMLGLLPPTEELVEASVCADHTGAENAIADLLQAMDARRQGTRTEAQYLESLRNLELLRTGQPLEDGAECALALHRERRERAKRLVAAGTVRVDGGVALVELDEEIDGSFFVPLLPEATVIMLVTPHPSVPERRAVKLRLGANAPSGLTLHQLGVHEWDKNYGGRWNAGSSKRGGGSAIVPAEYASRVRSSLADCQ